MMILQLKRNPDGTINKYKARLVALGNQQTAESYNEISSCPARSASVKLLMAMQAKLNSVSAVLDVKGAYLKTFIQEESNEKLYLRLPDGSTVKLLKYLYGLKQAGYQWQQNLTGVLRELGYASTVEQDIVKINTEIITTDLLNIIEPLIDETTKSNLLLNLEYPDMSEEDKKVLTINNDLVMIASTYLVIIFIISVLLGFILAYLSGNNFWEILYKNKYIIIYIYIFYKNIIYNHQFFIYIVQTVRIFV